MRKVRILGPATKVTFKMFIPEHDIERNRHKAAATLRKFADILETGGDWMNYVENAPNCFFWQVEAVGKNYLGYGVEYITAKEVYDE